MTLPFIPLRYTSNLGTTLELINDNLPDVDTTAEYRIVVFFIDYPDDNVTEVTRDILYLDPCLTPILSNPNPLTLPLVDYEWVTPAVI